METFVLSDRSLLQNIILGEDNMAILDRYQNTTPPDVPSQPQSGGAALKLGKTSTYYTKLGMFFIVMMISVILAYFLRNIIANRIFPSEELESKFDNENLNIAKRRRKLILATFVYILVVITCIIFILASLFFNIYLPMWWKNTDPNAKIFPVAFKKYVDTYFISEGKFVKDIAIVGGGVFLFSFIYVTFYLLMIRPYLENIYYATRHLSDPNIQTDDTQPSKYLMNLSIFIALMLFYAIILLMLRVLLKDISKFKPFMLILMIYPILTLIILRLIYERKNVFLILFLFALMFAISAIFNLLSKE